MIGTSKRFAISGTRTSDDAPSAFLKPPPSAPSTTRPSTPAAIAFSAPRMVGTTWKTVMPSSFSCGANAEGSPADVVTNEISFSTTKSTMPGRSRMNIWARFTPNGFVVSSRIAAISPLIASRSPDEVSMMPRPPASETADASWLRAIHPIGACTMGISIPSISVIRVFTVDPPHVGSSSGGDRRPDRPRQAKRRRGRSDSEDFGVSGFLNRGRAQPTTSRCQPLASR